MKHRDLIKLLITNGFILDRIGGHLIYKKGPITVAVPNHATRGHSIGLIRRLLTQAGFDKQFIRKYI
jgi:predicted RNA binding protein YcfA (HicA-like mRNA interferase family)